MFAAIMIGAGLVAVSIMTSALAFRFGTPLLLIFLFIGILAGEDGLGLRFDDAELAFLTGSLALAIILFDSGFGTRTQALQRAAAPAFVLATLGVLLTTLLVSIAARFLFDLPWLYALLMGAIISSTDAAAVFFLLRAGGVRIYKRVRSVLEIESGSNDPMAIFLTVLFIELILTEEEVSLMSSFLTGFGLQMGLGIVMGLVAGYLIVKLVNRLRLEEELSHILVIALALSTFGLTAHLGGSGFLAIYILGIVAGNIGINGSSAFRRYQKGMTWLAQIIMFLVLGLFITPSELVPVLMPALLLGVFLILVGRPLAVWICLVPFRYDWQTVSFSALVGLRGAVSILLGILPAVMGVEDAEIFLNVAFVMVLTSLLVQGWSIRPLAKGLDLILPARSEALERIELELPGSPKHELLIYRMMKDSPFLKEIHTLPRWAQPSLVIRNGNPVPIQQVQKLESGDLVYLFATPEYARLMDRLFANNQGVDAADTEFFGQFRILPEARLVDLLTIYGMSIPKDLPTDLTVADFMETVLGGNPVVGDRVPLGNAELVVRQVHLGTRISEVGLSLLAEKHSDAYLRRYMRSGRKKPDSKREPNA
jgi:cell volume regulation protein A